ncbi:MAG: MBL fold metallo-hydrolase, partial [Pseudomonadota bacterium]
MKLTVRSHQYAVGQGGMHVGRLQLNEAQEFTFLYDCGGKRSLLQDAVNRAFPPDGELDLAILSHLHEDHVRGFDLLATRVKVKTVWIPFIE